MRTAPTADVPAQTIMEYLRAGGATGLRASHGLVWVIGHAPSGVLIQILWRPELGYRVSRGTFGDGLAECLGVSREWEIAVAHALDA